MAVAQYAQGSFLGGEWSQTAQGNWADPKYKIAMNVSFNGFPMEPGAWTKRSGTRWLGFTRKGAAARVIPFDFEEAEPYTMEVSNGFIRFWNNTSRVTTNDSVAVTAVSAANPAVIALASAVTWATGDAGFFSGLGTNSPLLQNRVFSLTYVDTSHFTLTDEVTGLPIDGSAIGTFVSGTFNHLAEVATPYTASLIPQLRRVQTEERAVLLHGQIAPQQLIVATDPTGPNFATFTLGAVQFLDGPYLDPVPGSNVNLSGGSGIVTLTLTFQAYSSTVAYANGEFVVSSSIGYQSLIDGNVNNTPASSPTAWKVVGFGAAINNGRGFVASDIGRLVRLYAEPPLWATGTTYAAGAVVTFNATGLPGQSTYWTSLVANNTGKTPGADITNWSVTPANTAVWSWGKVLALSTTGFIPRNLSGAVPIGNMTAAGGLAAAFDGVLAKTSLGTASATRSAVGYVGQDFSGASAQTISQVVLWPSTDFGFSSSQNANTPHVQLNLYASNTLPGSSEDGTLLGTSGIIANIVAPVTVLSSDTVSTWNDVWVEAVAIDGYGIVEMDIAQVQFYSSSASPGTAVSIEILGAVLPYTAIQTWRLGVYSNTTTWPTAGTYSDGRLWLTGAVANRIDASYVNGILGNTVNFSPTQVDGSVTDANGISYTFNAPDANPIFWMEPDLQGIVAGTQAGEWLVVAPTSGGISALNIAARRATKIRCANMEPRRTEHTIVFVQAYQRKLMEYFPDIFSGKFTAPNLSEKWKHLTGSGIAELAYQQELIPIVWMRMNDGTLVGATYKRDTLMTSTGPTFIGAHHHALGSGDKVVSICAGASEDGNLDALSMVTTNGPTYAVEMLTDLFEEQDQLVNAWFLDKAVTPSSFTIGPTSIVFNGLTYLNGTTATAFISGVDCGDWPVTHGSMTVPLYGQVGQTNPLFTAAFLAVANAQGLQAVVGYSYTAQGQVLPPVDPQMAGTRTGPALANTQRTDIVRLKLVNTQGLSVGTSFTDSVGGSSTMKAVQFKTKSGEGTIPIAANQLFTGTVWAPLTDPYSLTSKICWQTTRPLPATIAAIGGTVQTADQ